jgi:outer membrane protein assembly factor BamB/tetratricopeptide (TPR) repeat protein
MSVELSGSATPERLLEALRRVVESRAVYSLVVSDGISERIFYFAIGGIRVIGSGPRPSPPLGEILVDDGRLQPQVRDQLLETAQQNGRRFGEVAVQLGHVSQADVDAAIEVKVEEELLDLFVWDGAELRLAEGQPPKAFYEGRFHSASLSCNVSDYLSVVLARLEEWKGIVGRLPTGREVYQLAPGVRPEHQPPPFSRLLGLVDGTRTASEAVHESRMRRVRAYEFLLTAVRDGKLQRVAGSAAKEVTREACLAELDALKAGLDTSVAPQIVQARLARTYERLGEKGKAAQYWKALGDHFRRQNELKRARDCYRSSVKLLPTDFATRELILEIHRHLGNTNQLIADGRPLANLFLKHNLLNRAKLLLQQLVNAVPTDAGLRRQLALVLMGLGEREAALKHLRQLATLLRSRNASGGELRDVYVRILALNPSDSEAKRALDEITGASLHRRMLIGTLAGTAMLLACLIAWFSYESSAGRELSLAMAAARRRSEAGEYDVATQLLQKAIDEYSWATSKAAAEHMIESIAVAKREARRLQAAQEALGGGTEELSDYQKRQKDEEDAQALARRARDLVARGRMGEGHTVYSQLFELYPTSGALADVRVPMRLNVLPMDAEVYIDGDPATHGSSMISYEVVGRTRLEVRAKGFVTYKRTLEGVMDLVLQVDLSKPERWRYATDAPFEAPPLLDADTLYVAGRDRFCVALSARDGTVRWKTPLGFYADVSTRPVRTSAGIVLGTAVGEALCLDAGTGEVLWRKQVGNGISSQPLRGGDEIALLPADDGSLVALLGNGDEAWSLPAGTLAGGAPLELPGRGVAFVDRRGAITLIDPETGSPVEGWQAAPSGLRGEPAATDSRIWAWAGNSSLHMLSAETGRLVRRVPVPKATPVRPTVFGDFAYLVNGDYRLMGFHAHGKVAFTPRNLAEPAFASSTIAGGRLYVPGAKGHLFVVDADTGELLWRFDAGAPIAAQPIVRDGVIYVATVGGEIIVLEE